MRDDRLIDRLRDVDPATPERLAAAARDTDEMRRRILSTDVDELAIRRRARRRRVGIAAAAAFATAALLVPLVLLLPLRGDDTSVGSTTSPTLPPTPTSSPKPTPTVDPGPLDPIEVAAPVRGATVTSPVTVSGTADVFEATVSIRIVDATGNVIADTFTTASCGSGCRGDYSLEVPYSVDTEQPGVIEVFEVSAEDGSMIHTVRIPVTLVPGPPDEVAASLEGAWQNAHGTTVGDGSLEGGPLVLQTFEGPAHCGQSSITFLHAAWPLGSAQSDPADPWRQYARDTDGLLADQARAPFEPDATLPADATFSGYSHGSWQLWTSPRDVDTALYLVDTATLAVERWPRIRPIALCM